MCFWPTGSHDHPPSAIRFQVKHVRASDPEMDLRPRGDAATVPNRARHQGPLSGHIRVPTLAQGRPLVLHQAPFQGRRLRCRPVSRWHLLSADPSLRPGQEHSRQAGSGGLVGRRYHDRLHFRRAGKCPDKRQFHRRDANPVPRADWRLHRLSLRCCRRCDGLACRRIHGGRPRSGKRALHRLPQPRPQSPRTPWATAR